VAERPEITRLVLQSYAAQAVAANQTLGSALLAAGIALVPGIMAGKVLMEAESSGTVAKYEFPIGKGALQPTEVAAMMSRLLDLYQVAIAPATVQFPGGYGAALPAGVGANDAAILAWMLGQLTVIRSFSTDHSNSGIRI
jgi:hypothetical protein